MARKRFVTSEISTDRKIAKLAEKNPIAAALWPWFITALDDWGRMSADPVEVKLTIFPAFPYTSDEIEEIIQLYHQYGIAYYYKVDGKPYLAVNPETWYKYQTYIRQERKENQKSKYPEPEDAPWIQKNNAVKISSAIIADNQQSSTINVPSPSPSPSLSLSREREMSAHARDNTSQENACQEENQEKPKDFAFELKKINDKAFEYGMNGITPEFLEDAKMRLSEGTDVDLIIKALSIGATNAHGNAGAKCRYAIRILQGWAAEGIKTLTQWEAKNAPKPKARDKPDKSIRTKAQERDDAFNRAMEEAKRMLRQEGVIQDDV
jgi:DnaD/phage-associated family protein